MNGKEIGILYDEYKLDIFNVVLSVIGLGTVGYLFEKNLDTYGWISLVICGTLIAIITIKSAKQRDSLETLKKENATLSSMVSALEDEIASTQQDYHDLVDRQLGNIAKSLDFTNSERLSLYKHDDKLFYLLGRFSHNQNFKKRGRGTYPDTQGYIAKAWQEGKYHIKDLPDYNADARKYIAKMVEHCSIDEETIRKMVMKSRNYYIIALKDTNLTYKAVIAFESINRLGLNIVAIDTVIATEESKLLAFIEAKKFKEPSIRFAKEKGF